MAYEKNKAKNGFRGRTGRPGDRQGNRPGPGARSFGRGDAARRTADPDKRRVERPESGEKEINENMVVGRNAVKELLASGRDIDKIYVQSGEREGSIIQLIGEAAGRKIPLAEVDRAKLDKMSGFARHQGIVAFAAEQNYSTLDDMLTLAAERGEAPLVVIADGILDPQNLGSLIRVAECTGAHGVLIPKRRAVGLTALVGRASAGAIEHLPVARVPNVTAAIEDLKERGFWIFAADMGGTPYYDSDFSGPVAIVLGSEGEGISRLVREKCDFVTSIPLHGKVQSMNVSTAAAVILAEAARQRDLKKE